MKFTIDAEFTVNVSWRDLPGALRAIRQGNLDALLDRVTIVDSDFNVRR